MSMLDRLRMWANPGAHGWDAIPGTYRCDNGWTDDSGTSWKCRSAGTHEDAHGNWVCDNPACSTAVIERNSQ